MDEIGGGGNARGKARYIGRTAGLVKGFGLLKLLHDSDEVDPFILVEQAYDRGVDLPVGVLIEAILIQHLYRLGDGFPVQQKGSEDRHLRVDALRRYLIDRLLCGHVGLFLNYPEPETRFYLGMDFNGDLVNAELFYRLFDDDIFFVYRNAFVFERVGNSV